MKDLVDSGWSDVVREEAGDVEGPYTEGPYTWCSNPGSRSQKRGGTRVDGLEPSTAGFVERKRRFLPYLVPDSDHFLPHRSE